MVPRLYFQWPNSIYDGSWSLFSKYPIRWPTAIEGRIAKKGRNSGDFFLCFFSLVRKHVTLGWNKTMCNSADSFDISTILDFHIIKFLSRAFQRIWIFAILTYVDKVMGSFVTTCIRVPRMFIFVNFWIANTINKRPSHDWLCSLHWILPLRWVICLSCFLSNLTLHLIIEHFYLFIYFLKGEHFYFWRFIINFHWYLKWWSVIFISVFILTLNYLLLWKN